MNDMKQSHHAQGGPESAAVQKVHRLYWKRAHQDWRVWVGVFLIAVAMSVYVMSDSLALRFRSHPQPPPVNLRK